MDPTAKGERLLTRYSDIVRVRVSTIHTECQSQHQMEDPMSRATLITQQSTNGTADIGARAPIQSDPTHPHLPSMVLMAYRPMPRVS